MEAFGKYLVLGVPWLVRMAFAGVFWLMKGIWRGFGPTAKVVGAKSKPSPAQLASSPVAQTAVPAPIAVQPVQTKEYGAADRIVSVPLMPDVGVIRMRIYIAQAVVKSDLIVSDHGLRALLGGRSHSLADKPFDAAGGLVEAKKELIDEATRRIKSVMPPVKAPVQVQARSKRVQRDKTAVDAARA